MSSKDNSNVRTTVCVQIYDRKYQIYAIGKQKCCFDVRFDEETHGTFRRIYAADDSEAETFFAWSFLVDDCVKRVRDLRARSTRQSTKVGTFFRPFDGQLAAGASSRRRGRAANSQVATAGDVDAVAPAGGRRRDATVATIIVVDRWLNIIG